MNAKRFQAITEKYRKLRIAVVGDFCLDRYLEIDPAKKETSLETGLPVHNVVNVRAQPGGAGTILSNLVALGIGTIYPVGFAGNDGEGFELRRAFRSHERIRLDYFFNTSHRRTFTYCKPLLVRAGEAPVELNRLDVKNWTPTPAVVQGRLADALIDLIPLVDEMIVLDQTPIPGTGVVTKTVLGALGKFVATRFDLNVLADSRTGFKDYPRVALKMNQDELAALTGPGKALSPTEMGKLAGELARQKRKPIIVTLAERGILGASPDGDVEVVTALPLRGAIDIVGAGDAVTANLTVALAAGAKLREALEIANAAASVVIHQLGTTGTATVKQIRELLHEK